LSYQQTIFIAPGRGHVPSVKRQRESAFHDK